MVRFLSALGPLTSEEEAFVTSAVNSARPGRMGWKERVARAALVAHPAKATPRIKTGISFHTLAEKLRDLSNVQGCELTEFLRGHGMETVPVLTVGTWSLGGRRWLTTEGADPAELQTEGPGDGWLLFREEELREVEFTSNSSGAKLLAKRDGEAWSLAFTPGVNEYGRPHLGTYWHIFQGC